MATQGSTRLKIVNDQPSVEKLWNGRVRLEFFCDNDGKKKDWYGQNISRILPEFGIKMGDKFGEGEWSLPDGAEYDDMTLVEAETQFVPQAGTHYVKLVYETLTSVFVESKQEDPDFDLNGLHRVVRTFVALPDAPYTEVVGTSTIVVDGDTLFLSKYEIKKTDAKWELTESWIEAGTLSVATRTEAEGVRSVTTTFLVTEGSTVGPIVDRSISNFEGLQTIIVKTLQDRNGNALGADGANPVSQFDQYVDFRYPGEVSIASDTDTVNNVITGDIATTWNSHWYSLQPPVTTEINARIFVFFQTSNEIVAADLVFDGAVGLWNPDSWAEGRVDGLGTNFALSTVRQTAQDKVFNEYTVVSGGTNSVSGTAEFADAVAGATLLEGTYIVPSTSFSITVTGGPGRPDGIKYVVQAPVLTPAFDDVDGNQVWKKTIIVATIPTR